MTSPRHNRERDWLAFVAGPGAAARHRSALGGNFFHDVGDFFDDIGHSIERAARSVGDSVSDAWRTTARSLAVDLLFGVGGSVVAAGAGGPLIQAGVAAGASGEVLTQDAVIVAETAKNYGPILAPEETNKILQEIATFANRVDAFGTIYTMAFTELTIQAETSKKRRDDLRLRIAQIKADVARRGGVWLVVAKHVYQALQTVVIAIATAGLGVPVVAGITVLDIVEFAVSAAQVAIELENARELARISKEKLEEQRKAHEDASAAEAKRLEDEIAKLRKEIEELGGLAHDGTPVTRKDLDPGVVALLGPEGGAPLLKVATLDWALGLSTSAFAVVPPPSLEEVLARTTPPFEPQTTTVVRHVFHWVPGLRR